MDDTKKISNKLAETVTPEMLQELVIKLEQNQNVSNEVVNQIKGTLKTELEAIVKSFIEESVITQQTLNVNLLQHSDQVAEQINTNNKKLYNEVEESTNALFSNMKNFSIENNNLLVDELKKYNTSYVNEINKSFDEGIDSLVSKLATIITDGMLEEFCNKVEESKLTQSSINAELNKHSEEIKEQLNTYTTKLVNEVENNNNNFINDLKTINLENYDLFFSNLKKENSDFSSEINEILKSSVEVISDKLAGIITTQMLTEFSSEIEENKNNTERLNSSIKIAAEQLLEQLDKTNDNVITSVENKTNTLFEELESFQTANNKIFFTEFNERNEGYIAQMQQSLGVGIEAIADKLADTITKETLENFINKIEEHQNLSSSIVNYINSEFKENMESTISDLLTESKNAQRELNENLNSHVEEVMQRLVDSKNEVDLDTEKNISYLTEEINKQITTFTKYIHAIGTQDEKKRSAAFEKHIEEIENLNYNSEDLEKIYTRISALNLRNEQLEDKVDLLIKLHNDSIVKTNEQYGLLEVNINENLKATLKATLEEKLETLENKYNELQESNKKEIQKIDKKMLEVGKYSIVGNMLLLVVVMSGIFVKAEFQYTSLIYLILGVVLALLVPKINELSQTKPAKLNLKVKNKNENRNQDKNKNQNKNKKQNENKNENQNQIKSIREKISRQNKSES